MLITERKDIYIGCGVIEVIFQPLHGHYLDYQSIVSLGFERAEADEWNIVTFMLLSSTDHLHSKTTQKKVQIFHSSALFSAAAMFWLHFLLLLGYLLIHSTLGFLIRNACVVSDSNPSNLDAIFIESQKGFS